jgi:glucosamine 6-phosphate synthetase-like amidotransferase/phosphosugar isomerase protein
MNKKERIKFIIEELEKKIPKGTNTFRSQRSLYFINCGTSLRTMY